jgi:hypothetical protein
MRQDTRRAPGGPSVTSCATDGREAIGTPIKLDAATPKAKLELVLPNKSWRLAHGAAAALQRGMMFYWKST